MGVITSYSIHYTKLYEACVGPCCNNIVGAPWDTKTQGSSVIYQPSCAPLQATPTMDIKVYATSPIEAYLLGLEQATLPQTTVAAAAVADAALAIDHSMPRDVAALRHRRLV